MLRHFFRASIFPLLFLVIGVFSGLYLREAPRAKLPTFLPTEDEQTLRGSGTDYRFVNPLLECGSFDNVSNRKINDIKRRVGEVIVGLSANQSSVYFRDLNNGPWFGFAEKETFVPGSLLKVPLLIALYKAAETDSGLLSRKVLYEGGHTNFSEYFKPEKMIEEGKIYTIEELIRRMIVYSDNDATLLLSQVLPRDAIEQTYFDLGIDAPKDENYSMAVRTYASFFRILYNGTYLNKESSEKALALLNESTFAKGIRSAIPESVVVANKFGEREGVDSGGKQLHDCGIIYYPGQPYLLCIMTRGNNFDDLAKEVSKISAVIYEGISAKSN